MIHQIKYNFLIISILFLGLIIFSNCEDRSHYKYHLKSETEWGNNFIGVWENTKAPKFRFKIEAQIREGKLIEDRFDLSLVSSPISDDSTYTYIKAGQYNHHTTLTKKRSAQSGINTHPFKEFIHSNGSIMTDEGLKTVYLAFYSDSKNFIMQKVRHQPEKLIFRRIIFKNK